MNANQDVTIENGNENQSQTYEFEAEIDQVMSIMINSVYSTKDVFLKELVTNSADALTKLMVQKMMLSSAGYEVDPTCTFGIQIILNKENRTVTIKDNGIGMTKSELVDYLGKIASSGTRKFREMAEKATTTKTEAASEGGLVGQFGLGFYSGFLVADQIDVITKSVKDEGYLWSSREGRNYTIRPFAVDFNHGMEVILHLKEGEDDYLDANKISDIAKKYSMCSNYKLTLLTYEDPEPEKEEAVKDNEVEGEKIIEEIKEENEEKPKVTAEKKLVEKVLTSEAPMWNKKAKDIPAEDLKKLYTSISNSYDDYAAVESWYFEGGIDLNIMLFLPKKQGFPLFEKTQQKNGNIKVYNAGTFVTDNLDSDVVPEWMGFVHGVVSSPNLPVNISRESIQGNGVFNLLKNKLPNCVFELVNNLKTRESDKFLEFYNSFNKYLKLAVKDHKIGFLQNKFAALLTYPNNQDDKLISFDDYIARVPQDNKEILIHTGMTLEEVRGSIYLNDFKDRLVLLMGDPNDEIMLQGLTKYNEYQFQHIASEGADMPVSDEDAKTFEPIRKAFADLFKDSLEKVRLTYKESSVPALLYFKKITSSFTMERIIKLYMANNARSDDTLLKMMLGGKRICDINVNSPVIRAFQQMLSSGTESDTANKYINTLHGIMQLACGTDKELSSEFIATLFDLLESKIMSVSSEKKDEEVIDA